ncbi:prephenate dehydrogenase [Fructobacillus pseudoficulneus]|uniref:Prephenate dehydrogenase n=1 Tax=Fructobacillus pseudoficulneus TaxID=220714 RepID=A0A3F3H6L8_9LACO|nr:prephenate dehydrogenase/arogenate dehydrogenase family protein [Fructobacillus pseudoficulneus]GAP02509.1 prephenate dehydrogenase [Fructobacillus pseudoficulneus]SEH37322.1 prephenate dehydrogenase [Fructobacillus pseudoficulneus]
MKSVFINGLGLIGATMAKIIKASNPDTIITAHDTNPNNIDYMVQEGIVDHGVDFATGAKQADLILLATPVSIICQSLADLTELKLKDGVLVTDVGSSKQPIMAAAHHLMDQGVHFLGGHPMAGSHLTGSQHSDVSRFINHSFFLVNGNASDSEITAYKDLLKTGQLSFSALTAAQHDQLVSATSHLPHLAAFALANTIIPEVDAMPINPGIPSGGLLDTTRVAKADPTMWTAIFTSESEELLEQLDHFEKQLNILKEAIQKQDGQTLQTELKAANQARLKLEEFK